MEIRCRCTGCSASFKVDAKYAGKKARCPKCQAVVEVPLADESTVIVPRPPATAPAVPAAPAKPGAKTVAIPVTRPPAAAAPSQPAPAAPAASDFPVFTAPANASPAGAASPRKRKKASPLPLVLAGGAFVLVAAAAAVAVILATSSGPPANVAKKTIPAAKATLVLDWPQEERSGGSLVIDGQRRAVPAAGAVKFTLPPGEHEVVMLRRGFEPFDTIVNLSGDEEAHLAPQWKEAAAAVADSAEATATPFPIGTAASTTSVRGFDGWHQMLELAKRDAIKAQKDILIVFGCSDAQRATQQLARELEAAGVKASHVCLVIDIPRTSEGYDLVADRAQNEALLEEFGIKSLPTLALADERGRTYFVHREWDEGFGDLATKLTEWSRSKDERDALLAAAEQGSDQERLEAAAKAVKWMQDRAVWRFYGEQIGQWMAAAGRLDPENKQAVLEVFFEPQWFIDLVAINEEDAGAVARIAAQLQPWVDRKFHDPDRGAKLHMTAGFLLAQVERYDEATAQIEHAVKYQPKDAKLAEAIDEVKRRLAHKDLLGTGTGFLISSAGYVLTNYHVIEGNGRIEVRLYEEAESLPAEVIAKDEERDIAILKIAPPPADKFQPLPLAAGDVGRGDAVAAFGFPLSTTLGSGLKFTQGVVSAMPDPTNEDMYLLDLRVNPGNSGGPLCDPRGNVVGMITAKTGNFGFEDSYALAIPAADVLLFLEAHLPAGTPRAAPSEPPQPLSWGQVDRQVKTGVLMVLNKKK